MNPTEKAHRLRDMLGSLALDHDGGLEAMLPERLATPQEGGTEAFQPLDPAPALARLDRGEATEADLEGFEAIILPRLRPVTLVQADSYPDLPEPWTHLNTPQMRARLEPLLPSIGRVELPNNPRVPYGGTGFIVAPDLVMTNRHVAQIFTRGVGVRALVFRHGDAAIDFEREQPQETVESLLFVREVAMIHPYWDMALLRVDGIPADRKPLTLAVTAPEALEDKDVVVVGYPARDERNDLGVQDRVFRGTYYVKRLQPGKARKRASIRSFEQTVSAMVHDASTLGGNSGSAVIEAATGQVVGLHFAGVYLKANYSVPMHELARDPRVIDAGLTFAGAVPPSTTSDAAWRRVETETTTIAAPPRASSVAYVTVPLRIAVSVGDQAITIDGETEALKAPIILDGLEERSGYSVSFLGRELPLPSLTTAGKTIVARTEDDTPELHYHHFSVVMHKRRRLALFTAANVDWRTSRRTVDGRKPTRRQLTGLGDHDQEKWVIDPRIPQRHQLPDVFFTKDDGAFDKGHLVRRDDVCWGDTFDDIQRANGDTYHTTNCSPQTAGFNRSNRGVDNWGDLENLVQKETRAEQASVFSGPVLADDDRFFYGRDEHGKVSIQIPRRFWKIIVVKSKSHLQAYGFLLEQDLRGVPLHEEFIVPARWRRKLAPISEIEQLLGGWLTLSALLAIDAGASEEGVHIRNEL